MEGTQWEKAVVRDSRVEEVDRGKFQTLEHKEQERSQKPSTQLVPSLNGSAWSTDKEYMRRDKDSFDNFSGKEHRMRKEEMEEQFNKETKQGWRFAANAARIIDDNAGNEDCKHTSGVVLSSNPH